MRIVIALGGNAILQRGQPLEESIQKENIHIAAKSIAEVARKHQVILTHGNGPQVGLLALQNDAYKDVSPYSLDVLGAETEGMIGYLFEQALRNILPNRQVVTLLTQTIVDEKDTAFQSPTKFVGPVYSKEQAEALIKEKQWAMEADGQYYRRVVPSPMPQAILELPVIKHITQDHNIIIICTGGGGIPVIQNQQGLQGIEGVVDKDRASNVLAQGLDADGLIMLTDIDAVETNFGKPDSKKIKQASPEAMNELSFAKGSMAPKVESACEFVKVGGKFSGIGSLFDAVDIINGVKGTMITKESEQILYY